MTDTAATTKKPMKLPKVEIFTDGACSGNPGPGGWGVLLRMGETERELYGGEVLTTNNRMELMAAIQALEAMKRPVDAVLTTDSQYVRNGVMTWMKGWKARGWVTADRKPVKNIDLWQRLDAAHGVAQGPLGMDPRPCRPCRERAGRRAGPEGPARARPRPGADRGLTRTILSPYYEW